LGEDCNKINYQPLAYQTKRGQRKKCVNPLDKMIEFSVLFPGCDPQMKLSQVTGARGPVGTTVVRGEVGGGLPPHTHNRASSQRGNRQSRRQEQTCNRGEARTCFFISGNLSVERRPLLGIIHDSSLKLCTLLSCATQNTEKYETKIRNLIN